MAYNVSKFGLDRAIMKGTLLEEQSALSAVRPFPFKRFSVNSIFCNESP